MEINNNKDSSINDNYTIDLLEESDLWLVDQPTISIEDYDYNSIEVEFTNHFRDDVTIYWELWDSLDDSGNLIEDSHGNVSDTYNKSFSGLDLDTTYYLKNVHAKSSDYFGDSIPLDPITITTNGRLNTPLVEFDRKRIGTSSASFYYTVTNTNNFSVKVLTDFNTNSTSSILEDSDITLSSNETIEIRKGLSSQEKDESKYFHVRFDKDKYLNSYIETNGPQSFDKFKLSEVNDINTTVVDTDIDLEFRTQGVLPEEVEYSLIGYGINTNITLTYSVNDPYDVFVNDSLTNLFALNEYLLKDIINTTSDTDYLDSNPKQKYLFTGGDPKLPTPYVFTGDFIAPDYMKITVRNENDYGSNLKYRQVETDVTLNGVVKNIPHSDGTETVEFTFNNLQPDTSYLIEAINKSTYPEYTNSDIGDKTKKTLPNVPTPIVDDIYMSNDQTVVVDVSNNNSVNFPNLNTDVNLDSNYIRALTEFSSLSSNSVNDRVRPGETISIKAKNIWADDENYSQESSWINYDVPRVQLEDPYIFSGYDTLTENSIRVRVRNNNDNDYAGGTNYPSVKTEVWISNPITTAKQSVTTSSYRDNLYFEFTDLDPNTTYTVTAKNISQDNSYSDSGIYSKDKETETAHYDVIFYGFTENFEDQSIDGWYNRSTNDEDWQIHDGSTGSSGTGPSSAYEGTYYAYVETSSGGLYEIGDRASLAFDFGSNIPDKLEFNYHAYGSDIGKLIIGEVYDGYYDETTVIDGDQGNQWNSYSYDIPYNLIGIYIIYEKTIRDWAGDIAIDNLRFVEKEETVEHGSNATPPTDPDVPDYQFDGWSSNYTNVTSNEDVYAQFSQASYTWIQVGYDSSEPATTYKFTSQGSESDDISYLNNTYAPENNQGNDAACEDSNGVWIIYEVVEE